MVTVVPHKAVVEVSKIDNYRRALGLRTHGRFISVVYFIHENLGIEMVMEAFLRKKGLSCVKGF